jgi:hypothetical protein
VPEVVLDRRVVVVDVDGVGDLKLTELLALPLVEGG